MGQMGQMAGDQEALRRALGELMRRSARPAPRSRRALGEAELAMRAARDALQQGQAAQALDPEAQALDQLRQGGQAMMQEMQRMYGQGQGQMPGQQFGQAPNNRDPLGRSMYNQGGADLWGERVPTELDLGSGARDPRGAVSPRGSAPPADHGARLPGASAASASERGRMRERWSPNADDRPAGLRRRHADPALHRHAERRGGARAPVRSGGARSARTT